MSLSLIQQSPPPNDFSVQLQQNSLTLKLEAVCSSEKSEYIQWPHRPYCKHTEDPNLSQT